MVQRDEATLRDIGRACAAIAEFIAGMDHAQFLADHKTQSAIMHQLLIIGEAAKRLSQDKRDQLAAIPWRLIAGMRDHLIHGYDIVDLDEIWRTATRDVPELLAALTRR